MKKIEDKEDLSGKKVLLRLDLNVPLQDGEIQDETRINKIIPTLKFLLKKKSKIIIVSHIGRPKGKVVKELSLKPICEELQNKLGKKIRLIDENIKEIKNKNFFNNYNEDVFILENIRFYSEEESNDLDFAQHLSSFAKLYINDAFSCSHRDVDHQFIKDLESFGFVFNQRIPLSVGPQTNTAAQPIHAVEMLLPKLVNGAENSEPLHGLQCIGVFDTDLKLVGITDLIGNQRRHSKLGRTHAIK